MLLVSLTLFQFHAKRTLTQKVTPFRKDRIRIELIISCILCTTIFCFLRAIRSFSNNPLAENAETRRRREIQVIWLFLREQLAVGFLTW